MACHGTAGLPVGRKALSRKDDLGFAGGMNPTAVFVEVGEGADGVKDILGVEVTFVGVLDDVTEGELQVAIAQSEKIEGVGVVVDGGLARYFPALHDRLGAAPLQECFFDKFALRMVADGTLAGVALGCGEVGRVVLVGLLILPGWSS